MDTSTSILSSTWQALLEAAQAFRDLAPWEWMYDADVFGVQDPHTQEVGYCCILGANKSLTGIAVYKGRTGFASYERLSEIHSSTYSQQAFYQDCLMLSYQSYDALFEPEKALKERVPIPPTRPNEYPSFRDYTPGWLPWPIFTEAQAQFLLHAIQQAHYIAQAFQQDEEYLDTDFPAANAILIRSAVKQGEQLSWHNQWQEFPPFHTEKPQINLNKLFLRSNTHPLPRSVNAWQVDTFYFPNPTQGQSPRPYFPILLLVVEEETGALLGHQLFEPGEIQEKLQEIFVRILRKTHYLPQRLIVHRQETYLLLEELVDLVGISLELEQDTSLMNTIKANLFGSLSI